MCVGDGQLASEETWGSVGRPVSMGYEQIRSAVQRQCTVQVPRPLSFLPAQVWVGGVASITRDAYKSGGGGGGLSTFTKSFSPP